jgi:hypothetical protein
MKQFIICPECGSLELAVLANPILFEKPILNVKGKLSFFIPGIA